MGQAQPERGRLRPGRRRGNAGRSGVLSNLGRHGYRAAIGAGKLGLPESALLAFCLSCDMIAVGREAMTAIGCIQARRCHRGRCPTGVATQNRWLVRGLDPTHKSARLANYVVSLRKELTRLTHACQAEHPGLLTADHTEILDGKFGSRPLSEVFHYEKGQELPSEEQRAALLEAMELG